MLIISHSGGFLKGKSSFSAFPVKLGVEGVEILGIELVGCQAQPFTEALVVNDLALTQEADGIPHIGVVAEAQDVIVSGARFLFCCNCRRTT